MFKKKWLTSSLSILMTLILFAAFIPFSDITADAADTYNVLFPVKDGKISHYQKYDPSYEGHDGVDIVATKDNTIYAAKGGTVYQTGDKCPHHNEGWAHKGKYGEEGNFIEIKGEDGMYYWYYHLKQHTQLVKKGDKVKAGQAIATMGDSGIAKGVHLHFRMTNNSGYNSTAIIANPVGKYHGQVNYSYGPYTPHEEHKGCVNAKLEPFYFKNKATNTYMKASEAKNAGKMSLAAKKQNDSFIFSINGSKADGYYLESNLNKKFVVNPYSDTPSNGTAINMYKKNSDGTQLWEFDKCNGGFIIHMRYDPNLCLGADGSSIKLQNRTESDKQIWILEYKEEPSPDSISISTPATYDTYPVGAALDTTGLAITLHNSDGSTKEITSGFTASADLSAEGSATVTVTYEGKTVTYGVEVINYFEGQGTEASPYLINSEWDLKQLSDIMNTLSVCPAYKNAYYQQTADIDLVGELFTPIGICRSDDKVDGRLSFNGVYDGNKHSIANLYVDWSDNYSGLFGRTQANSVIKDLSVYGDVTGGGACTGGIAGEVGYGGKIINCSFNGSVYGTALVGGITSSLQGGGTVQGCYVNAGVQTEDSGETAWVGGIVGRPHVGNSKSSVDAVVSDCYFTGYISGAVSGGIIGKTVIETTKSNTVKCSNNYFSDNLGVNASGDGSVNESGGRQLSDEMMKNANELLGLPFVKNFNDGFNDGYPVFEWQEPIPEPPYAYMLGDVSGDGNIDIEDAVLVIGYVNGQTVLTDEELLRADTDLNNDIDIEDAVAIISHVNGINALF